MTLTELSLFGAAVVFFLASVWAYGSGRRARR